MDLPGLCCNVLHHWKKILHHQIRTVAAQLIEMLQANFPLLLLRTIRNAPQHIINCKMPLKKKERKKSTMKSYREKNRQNISTRVFIICHHWVPCLKFWDRKGTKVSIQGDLHITSRHGCSFPLPARALATGNRQRSSLCGTSLLR